MDQVFDIGIGNWFEELFKRGLNHNSTISFNIYVSDNILWDSANPTLCSSAVE